MRRKIIFVGVVVWCFVLAKQHPMACFRVYGLLQDNMFSGKESHQPTCITGCCICCLQTICRVNYEAHILVKSHLLLDGRQAGTPALLLCATIVSARSGSHLEQLSMIVIKRETAVSKVEVTAHYTVAKPSRFVSAPDPTDACGMLCNLRVLICWTWSGQSPISL